MNYPQIWGHTPTLSLEINEIENIFYFPNFQFTHAGHVILQLILYKLWR